LLPQANLLRNKITSLLQVETRWRSVLPDTLATLGCLSLGTGPMNEAMADAVSCLLSDKTFAKRLGEAGRNRVAERFSNQVSADSLLRIYHESLGQHATFSA
jgi:glycosyltransferase involved in cell wall biosynthesis